MRSATVMYLVHALGWLTKVQDDDNHADQD
jgi:hypothetical protein